MFVSAVMSCLMLLRQVLPRAVSRADWTAGNNSATSVPMIAITTNNSTSVKARLTLAHYGQLDPVKP